MELGTVADWVTATTGIVTAAAATYLAFRAEQVQRLLLQSELRKGIRAWADEVSDTIGEAWSVCLETTDAGDPPRRHSEVLAHLSSLIDRGRLLLPNHQRSSRGLLKEGAYRGVRDPALDALMECYRALKASRATDERAAERLVRSRRRFITEVQAVLNPYGYEATLLARQEETLEVDIQGR
jgi:hypothetical protein